MSQYNVQDMEAGHADGVASTSHTPGPWTWAGVTGVESGRGYYCIATELGLIEVAKVSNGLAANARLIAAAPDLVAALLEALELFDNVTGMDDGGSNALGCAENVIRAALDKAGVVLRDR